MLSGVAAAAGARVSTAVVYNGPSDGLGERAMLLLIDNYDSFTWNLAQYFGELGAQVKVVRNDEVTAA